MTFNDANVTGNYTVLHAKLSKPFRDQFSPERLREAFKVFNEKHIDFDLIASAPVLIFGGMIAFVATKLIVLYAIARFARMKPPRASLFSFSLAQGGEFAFVLISFAAGLGLLAVTEANMLVAIVALSMAAAPLLMMLDARVIHPRFEGLGFKREPDRIDQTGSPVIILGHGRFGMTVGRVLAANGSRATVLDHDAEQIDALRKFGFKVFSHERAVLRQTGMNVFRFMYPPYTEKVKRLIAPTMLVEIEAEALVE